MFSQLKHWAYKILLPGKLVRLKYRAFKELLHYDLLSQQHIAALEKIYYDQKEVDFCRVLDKFEQLSQTVSEVVERLKTLSPQFNAKLRKRFTEIRVAARKEIAAAAYESGSLFVLELEEITTQHANLVGGKAAHLAHILRSVQVPIPTGFAITTNAFHCFCDFNRLWPKIDACLAELDIHSSSSLETTSAELAAMVNAASIPPQVENAIETAITRLRFRKPDAHRFAVRSSAVAEDSNTSFAGQYRTLLNVAGEAIVAGYKEVIAGKYAPQALYYRIHHGLPDRETPMAALVLEMVPCRTSGVLYTRNPTEPDAEEMTLYSVWGLGELLVSGNASPDIITVSRGDRKASRVTKREIGSQQSKAVIGAAGVVETVPLAADEKLQPSLDDRSAEQLAGWGLKLEKLFESPQDIEWCQDASGRLFILQSRPLQIYQPAIDAGQCSLDGVTNPVLLSGGEKVASGIGVGRVAVASLGSDLSQLPQGSVLVTHSTAPELAKVIDRLNAVVADIGSSAGHFASIAREFGVPTLVNTGNATEILKPGETVTVFADAKIVLAGHATDLIQGPCGQIKPPAANPLFTRLSALLAHVSPLNLLDAGSSSFAPEACQTFHDILRFAHEKAVQEMFSLGRDGDRSLRGAKKFRSDIPILVYVMDLGHGLHQSAGELSEVGLVHIQNTPLRAVWEGLSHPDIHWSPNVRHFDWEAFDRISGGIVSVESPQLSSYAIVSQDYLNLNVRFGYHFVVVDTLCGEESDANYIFLRFKGGGGTSQNKRLRVLFLQRILEAHDFAVSLERDLIEAQLRRAASSVIQDKLDLIGRLLGCTRLLDMSLDDEQTVHELADQFLAGNYRFGPFAANQLEENENGL